MTKTSYYVYQSTSVLHFHQCLGSYLCKQITPEDHTRLNLPIKILESFIGYYCSNTKYLVLVYVYPQLAYKTATLIHTYICTHIYKHVVTSKVPT